MKSKLGKTPCRVAPIAAAVAVILGFSGSAAAFPIESGNPDISMTLDNVVRYNTAWRMKERDPGLANNLDLDEGDYAFDKGDMITNRIDLFSEFDFNYKRQMGFRISGQAWYDTKYGDSSRAAPGSTPAQQQIKNGVYDAYTKRYYHGPSGEFLDSFVWAQGNLGDTNILARFGRHSVIWGSGLVGSAQAVSYAQQPSDTRKGLQSPGANAKETALPVHQTTGTWQFQPNQSLSWQYQFEWEPNRLSLGGTYFNADVFSPQISGSIPRVDPETGNPGAWGLMYKWHPSFFDADLGLVYRKFSETRPWSAQLNANFSAGRYVYANNIGLWGLTLDTVVNDVAIGAEISHRTNMALNSTSSLAGQNAGPGDRFEGALGDTWHALVNATWAFNQTPIWSSAFLATELQYARLDKVTRNGAFYRSKSNSFSSPTKCVAGRDDIWNNCSTKEFYMAAIIFTPTWLQVYPGVDLSLANTWVMGLKGISPANGGGYEGDGQYQIKLGADYHARHKFELAYNAIMGKKRYICGAGQVGSQCNPAGSSGGVGGQQVKYTVDFGALADRDWLGFTYSYNF